VLDLDLPTVPVRTNLLTEVLQLGVSTSEPMLPFNKAHARQQFAFCGFGRSVVPRHPQISHRPPSTQHPVQGQGCCTFRPRVSSQRSATTQPPSSTVPSPPSMILQDHLRPVCGRIQFNLPHWWSI
ncbi:hypothetical protein NDU88_005496, partial [Pleurodeles waltl]